MMKLMVYIFGILFAISIEFIAVRGGVIPFIFTAIGCWAVMWIAIGLCENKNNGG